MPENRELYRDCFKSPFDCYISSRIICPKCKSNNLTLIEISTGEAEYTQENGLLNKGTSVETVGFLGVYAKCDKCNHSWRLRNVNQIIDILKNKNDWFNEIVS